MRAVGSTRAAIIGALPYQLRKEVRRAMRGQLLRRIPFVRGAPPDAIAAIARTLVARFAPTGTLIVEQGEVSSAMYLIERGEVEVRVSRSSSGTHCKRNSELASDVRLGEGAFFGEIGLLTRYPASCSVYATGSSDCTLLRKSVEPTECATSSESQNAYVGVGEGCLLCTTPCTHPWSLFQ